MNDREQTTIRLPADFKERIQRTADEEKKSFNNLVEIILHHWVKSYLVQEQSGRFLFHNQKPIF